MSKTRRSKKFIRDAHIAGIVTVASILLIAFSYTALANTGVISSIDNEGLFQTIEESTNSQEQASEDQATPDKADQSQTSKSTSESGKKSNTSTSADSIEVTVQVDPTAANRPLMYSGSVELNKGATAYDALCKTGLSVNARSTQYGIYVAGIEGLNEKDYGPQSGWVYYVNGSFPSQPASSYTLSGGESVSWNYVVD
ncbi:MAG: DUF4430 domain-containing protein [Eggerthellaceae bacterium]|jgi:hypothetical protein